MEICIILLKGLLEDSFYQHFIEEKALKHSLLKIDLLLMLKEKSQILSVNLLSLIKLIHAVFLTTLSQPIVQNLDSILPIVSVLLP